MQPTGMEDYLETESVEFEQREADDLQRYHNRVRASDWEAMNRERHPQENECPAGERFHFYTVGHFCANCGYSLKDAIDKINLEFLPMGEPIPYDVTEGITLASDD